MKRFWFLWKFYWLLLDSVLKHHDDVSCEFIFIYLMKIGVFSGPLFPLFDENRGIQWTFIPKRSVNQSAMVLLFLLSVTMFGI